LSAANANPPAFDMYSFTEPEPEQVRELNESGYESVMPVRSMISHIVEERKQQIHIDTNFDKPVRDVEVFVTIAGDGTISYLAIGRE